MASPLPRILATLVFLGFATAAPVRAQRTWTGTTSTAWSDPTNWSTAVPGSGSTALFNGPGNGNVLIDLGGTARPIGTILFDTSAAAAYTFSGNTGDAFRFDAGGAVTINSTVTTSQTFNSALQFTAVGFTATSFSLTGTAGGAVYVNFTAPVPEPGAVLAVCAAVLAAGGYVRRGRPA
jgi:hypothetical protein